jgi:hypothetical protein
MKLVLNVQKNNLILNLECRREIFLKLVKTKEEFLNK